MDEASVELEEVPFTSPAARAMVAAAEAELEVRYGPGVDGDALEAGSFSPPRGAFVIARLEGSLVGGVGLRSIAEGVGEVKRLWVDDAVRRRGVAQALMRAAEDHARLLGMHLIELETGPLQPEAVALYASTGWECVENLPIPVSEYDGALRFLKRYPASS